MAEPLEMGTAMQESAEGRSDPKAQRARSRGPSTHMMHFGDIVQVICYQF